MKDAQHCENLKKDMVKAQRIVKVLDMPIEDSITNGKIENMNTARDNVKKTLKDKWNITPDTLVGSTISINTRSICEGNKPIKTKKSPLKKLSELLQKKLLSNGHRIFILT